MKKHEITTALEALKPIRMNKIGDKKLKAALVSGYVTLVREKRKLDEDIAALKEAHLGNYAEEQETVGKLQQQLQTEADREKQAALIREINSHKELFAAITDFNKAIDDLGKEEIEIARLEQDKFIEEMDAQDWNLGLLDAVFPMFNS